MNYLRFHLNRPLVILPALAAAFFALALLPASAQNLVAEETTLCFGPYTLAEFGNWPKHYAKEGGPEEALLLKALAACKIYFIDKRAKKDGKWQFSGEEGYPKVLVEGTLSHKLTDKKGRDFIIMVEQFTASRDFPKHIPGWPDTCRGTIGVTVRVMREFPGGGYSMATIGNSRTLHYDANGRTEGLVPRQD